MSKSSKVESYQGQQMFIGIDVHKRIYRIASFIDGIVIKSRRNYDRSVKQKCWFLLRQPSLWKRAITLGELTQQSTKLSIAKNWLIVLAIV